ncbi:MAG: tetratricopeptide repeat protein [Desulfobacterales bacterium]|nr:MAG: tetratricopeptide repeat protein [Desulfobacterales bacterium]UCD89652.1 MAG: tetratricopeptide repeat protein [Desulfobacterales bacterium]
MKRMVFIWMLFLTSFFFACGSTYSTKKKPEPLTTGMREITKGITQYKKGCYKNALTYFFKAHELFTATDHQRGVAMSYNNIGNVYRASGDNKSAVLFFQESFSIYEDMGDAKGAVQILSNKAATLIDDGMLEEAAKTLSAAENIAKTNQILFGPLLNTRGILLIKKKEYAKAEEVLQTALTSVDSENFSESATVNFTLGNLMLETHRYEQAIFFFETALKADRLSGFSKGIADDLAAIGSTYLLQKKNDLAANVFKRSLKIYALLGNQKKVHQVMQQLENISESTGIDLGLTKYFVNSWLEGKTIEQPCD